MRILHTSDWHLGRTLYSKKERQEEHKAFLDWLLTTIQEEKIDLLLIAGDLFDTAAPSSSSQKIYYDFLIRVRNSGCKHVVIVGGNHDSPSFLNAPKEILSALNVTVIGNVGTQIEDEIVVVRNENGTPLLIVCAVPFLRERDISRFAEGENYADRSKRINKNIKKHYEEIAILAQKKRDELGFKIPIVATGHLSVTGGKRNEDDGVRETYIGNIETISSDIFPETFDYVALGHYHIACKIKENIRYCGSPIPMGFGEAKQKKLVYIVDFTNEMNIESIEIPIFQKLESIVGDKNYMTSRIAELKKNGSSVWIEMIYEGDNIFPDFTSWAYELTANSSIEILKIQNRLFLTDGLSLEDTSASLNELDVYKVFDTLLEKNSISEASREELKSSYQEIINALHITES
ncbi:MAG: exonuclease sbcCD subunit D [Bacteroidetes bacterium HGW-Bacteroidetes-19]|nr:MAG: exonuclease sbcCD subunit D [Bacteroidetes bacterium HGW-Bacteroidetes-20]PKP28479.1 MAG: exonuclease sbcCD subunit D [Bacteroidetes bacterium HGW-Bacteroidetes-19]